MVFLYTDYDITTRKKLFPKLRMKLRRRTCCSAEGSDCLVPVPTPAGAEAARAAASSAAAAEIAPCAAEATMSDKSQENAAQFLKGCVRDGTEHRLNME